MKTLKTPIFLHHFVTNGMQIYILKYLCLYGIHVYSLY